MMAAQGSPRHTLLVLAIFCVLLAGCGRPEAVPDRSIWDLALQGNFLWLCGWERLERVNLTDNSIENVNPPYFSCEHLLIATNGWVWAYRDTISVYDGVSWRKPNVVVHESINRSINFLSETRDGAIWVSSSLLSQYDPQTDQSEVIIPTLPIPTPTLGPSDNCVICTSPSPGHIGAVFEATDGALWFNEQYQGIVRWDRETNSKQLWKPTDSFGGFNTIPHEFIQARDGSIWMGTEAGVYRFHNGDWQSWDYSVDTHKLRSKENGDFSVLDMLEDAQGKVWVVFRSGLMVWDGSKWSEVGDFEYPEGPISVFQASSGEIWIGFIHREAVKYDNGSLINYPINIRTFLETSDHRLFGGGAEGLFFYNKQLDQWQPFPSK
jgi:ligand-binding sensor domain-containing protein